MPSMADDHRVPETVPLIVAQISLGSKAADKKGKAKTKKPI